MANIPERNSDLKELNKLVRVMLELALDDVKSQGVNPLVVETYRPQVRQNYLYCQGHTIAECVAKGINKSFAEAYCPAKIVSHPTKTVNSVHTSRKAVDVVPQRMVNKKMTAIWDINDPQTQIIIKTMQKYGFEAGANWDSFVDSPHFQVKGDFTSAFDRKHNTAYVTGAIQKKLKEIPCNADIDVDNKWGGQTDEAVNRFRKCRGYKTALGQIGAEAFRALFS
jgi:peptidoglycan L-alanyl-D-glutamate endopeptidase CwlK